MKKALTILASMALGVSMTSAVTVESKNVVGYYDVTLNSQGYSMIGVNWQGVDGNSVDLQDLFPTNALYAGAAEWDLDNCDVLIYWDNDIQDYFSYYYADLGQGVQWYDGNYDPANFQLKPGSSFWFYRPTTEGLSTAQLIGQVSTNASLSFVAKQGYSMISKGYPIVGLVGEGIAGYPGTIEWDLDNCDTLTVWDNAIQDYFSYYYADLGQGVQWYDGNYDPVSTDFTLGQGAWYYRQPLANLEWTETNPL